MGDSPSAANRNPTKPTRDADKTSQAADTTSRQPNGIEIAITRGSLTLPSRPASLRRRPRLGARPSRCSLSGAVGSLPVALRAVGLRPWWSSRRRLGVGAVFVPQPSRQLRAALVTQPRRQRRAARCVTSPLLYGVSPTARSEEHTSALQSRGHLVCSL